jgi:DnaJ-class molecular chaperone
MTQYARLVNQCQRCNGEGKGTFPNAQGNPTYEDPCTLCGGDGIASTNSFIDITDIYDKVEDILNKCNDILESIQGA